MAKVTVKGRVFTKDPAETDKILESEKRPSKRTKRKRRSERQAKRQRRVQTKLAKGLGERGTFNESDLGTLGDFTLTTIPKNTRWGDLDNNLGKLERIHNSTIRDQLGLPRTRRMKRASKAKPMR